MRTIEFFGNSKIQYECKYPWPEEIHVQCRDDIWNPYQPGILNSFEVYDGDFWWVGRGKSVLIAEKEAWEMFLDISGCDHTHYISDKDFPTGGAICFMCSVFNRKAFTAKDNNIISECDT